MTRRVYLYAFNNTMKIADCKFLNEGAISIGNMLRLAKWMQATKPEPMVIIAVDNRPGLYADFMEALKSNDFTKWIEFYDTVSREGIRVDTLISQGSGR